MAKGKKKEDEGVQNAQPEANPPNTIWADKEKEPPKSPVMIGITRIEVPDAESQKAGFYSPFSTRLVRSINGYKFFKPLGTK
jgi:hypothetical protein